MTTFQRHGGKAVLTLLLFAGYWGFRQWSINSSLDTGAVQAIKPWIIGHLENAALRESQNKPFDQLSQQERAALSQKLIAANRVEIKSIQAHGLGDRTVVRVEVLVDGKPPPDSKTIHYYKMNYSTLLGWSYRQEVDAVSYWLALW